MADWSAIISAFATVILVAVTGYYAYETRKSRELVEQTLKESEKDRDLTMQTLNEMRISRELGQMPVLTCEVSTRVRVRVSVGKTSFVDSSPIPSRTEEKYIQVTVTNMGNAPAIETVFRAELLNFKVSGWQIASIGGDLYTIASSASTSFQIGIPPGDIVDRSDKSDPQLEVVIRYKNVYGKEFWSTLRFQTSEWRFLAHELREQERTIPWYRLTEQIAIEGGRPPSTRRKV